MEAVLLAAACPSAVLSAVLLLGRLEDAVLTPVETGHDVHP